MTEKRKGTMKFKKLKIYVIRNVVRHQARRHMNLNDMTMSVIDQCMAFSARQYSPMPIDT